MPDTDGTDNGVNTWVGVYEQVVCIKYLIMSKAKKPGLEIYNAQANCTTIRFGALNVRAKRAKKWGFTLNFSLKFTILVPDHLLHTIFTFCFCY